MVSLRLLTRESEELLTLAVSVVEQQTKELRVDAARDIEDGGQKADVARLLAWSARYLAVFALAASCSDSAG